MPALQQPSHLAAELIAAAENCAPVQPFSARFESFSLADAAAVRQSWFEAQLAAGHRSVGRKIGAVHRKWRGHAQFLDPGWGYILDSTLLIDGTELPASHLIQPRVEAEFAFLLARDLAGPGVTAAHALAATAGVCAAFSEPQMDTGPTPQMNTGPTGTTDEHR